MIESCGFGMRFAASARDSGGECLRRCVRVRRVPRGGGDTCHGWTHTDGARGAHTNDDKKESLTLVRKGLQNAALRVVLITIPFDGVSNTAFFMFAF